jgi:outer membrane protein
MKIKLSLITLFAFLTTSQALAKDSNDWIVRGRALYVKTDAKGTADSKIGGNLNIDFDRIPEFDITKFITPNLAAELILGTTEHKVNLNNSALGASQNLGSVKLLPPTLTLQYHLNPTAIFKPYVGAGLNYTFFYGVKNRGVVSSAKYHDRLGYALQAGLDYMINEKFGINFDVKKIFLKTHVQINNSISSNVRIDPWLLGTGVSYHF